MTAGRGRAGFVALAVVAGLLPVFTGAAGPAAGAELPDADPARGLVYDGLRVGRAGGPCAGIFELETPARLPDGSQQPTCTHGPDPAPPGVDVRDPAPAVLPRIASQDTFTEPPFFCYGDGTDGYRVQAIYLRASDQPDRYDAVLPTLVQVLRQMDVNLNTSASETGGNQHVRFLADGSCRPVITAVTVSPAGDDSISAMNAELRLMGFSRTDRKYFVFADAAVYCGAAESKWDESASAVPGANRNNGHPEVPGMIARLDRSCWQAVTGLHELAHTLGAVQPGAPHGTAAGHCTDEWDVLCYSDAPGVVMTYPCADSHLSLLDCNHDDYFSTSPPPGNYLATHWNTSNSAFLSPVTAPGPPPNDTLASAQPVEGKVGRVRLFPTVGATKEPGEPDHAGIAGGSSIWFRWTAPLSRPVTFDTVESTFDTVLAVYTGAAYGSLTQVAAADDGSRTLGRSRLTFSSVAGTTYRMAVDGKAGAAGTVQLHWNYGGAGVDFDGDGDTERSVYRNGAWFDEDVATAYLGTATDLPVPGDFDGDGDTDRAVFRDGTWFTDGQATAFLGLAGDIPVPADYDGDGDVDRAVFRPSTGAWYVEGADTRYLGLSTDIPVPADYDGDGATDRAVYRPAVGGWYVDGATPVFLGLEGDIPLPGLYYPRHFAAPFVWRPSVGGWYDRYGSAFLGLPGDVPVPGDYNGDWLWDLGVYRPAVGGWYISGSPSEYLGLAGDVPLPLPQAVYRRFFGP